MARNDDHESRSVRRFSEGSLMQARNPQYNYLGTIDCEVLLRGQWLPFTADPNDPDISGNGPDIYQRALAGEFGEIAPGPTAAEIAQRRRQGASLSRMEFMLALDDAGLLDTAEALVDDATTPRRIKIMWRNAVAFDRANPDLIAMAQQMGVTEAQMDAVFGII